MNIAIILAGGVGSRVGRDIPKQFIKILDKPILAYTIEVFQNHQEIDLIEIVCIKSHINYVNQFANAYKYTKVKWIIPGGDTFQDSVIKGVDHLTGICNDDDILSIHFGASPFVNADIISDSIKIAKEKGNAISTTPFYLLSGIKTSDTMSLEYLDRDTIASMSSPHSFQYKVIHELYKKAREKNLLDKIDHPHITSLMYEMGYPIYFSKGNQSNIKITTEEDLELFEGYALLRDRKK